MSLPTGFVYLDRELPGIGYDPKYATGDNFVGHPVEGYAAPRIVATQEMAAALRSARRRAQDLDLDLLVWDAYRPLRAVDHFIRWAQEEEIPSVRREFHPRISRPQMFSRGYIACRSGHTRGAAVDLTLLNSSTGRPLTMGGRHDLMDERSHHGAPGVSDIAAQNRSLLAEIMTDSGFRPFASEWWHYSLIDEPHPQVYFDFPID